MSPIMRVLYRGKYNRCVQFVGRRYRDRFYVLPSMFAFQYSNVLTITKPLCPYFDGLVVAFYFTGREVHALPQLGGVIVLAGAAVVAVLW